MHDIFTPPTVTEKELTEEQVAEAKAATIAEAERKLVRAQAEAKIAALQWSGIESAFLSANAAALEAKKQTAAMAQLAEAELNNLALEAAPAGSAIGGLMRAAFQLVKFQAKKSKTISAEPSTVLAWVKQNVPLLVKPESYDEPAVIKTLESLPEAARPTWFALTEALAPAFARKDIEARVALEVDEIHAAQLAADTPVMDDAERLVDEMFGGVGNG